MNNDTLNRLYEVRFSQDERATKDRIWRVLCEDYFQQFIDPSDTVLDIACGFGEFIRHIHAARKIGIDLNAENGKNLPPDIEFICTSAESISGVPDGSVDVCFASNFFEHLESKAAMDNVLGEARRVLRPGGRFITMQPNLHYSGARYWDFYDHVLPLTHTSAAEGFSKNGFRVERLVPRFVPFSTKSALPQHPLLVKAYLRVPWLWKVMGGQFVLVARRD
jgi:ubiquinone/menaquinone biosynthesis C-methylase UbiE